MAPVHYLMDPKCDRKLAVVKAILERRRLLAGIEPIPLGFPVWEEALVELGQSPTRFWTGFWIEKGALKKCKGKSKQAKAIFQQYYLRILVSDTTILSKTRLKTSLEISHSPWSTRDCTKLSTMALWTDHLPLRTSPHENINFPACRPISAAEAGSGR
jgi:hypothetical protein